MGVSVVSIGEVLWDLLPGGPQLGGAPANLACHARALGADARLVSRVGDDDLGREALARLARHGLPPATVPVDPGAPTGTVDVVLGPGGTPTYTIREGVAWDRIAADPPALAAAAAADALTFGTLAQRAEPSRTAIRALVHAARPGALRLLDVNLRPPFVSREIIEASLDFADALKLNDEELPVLAAMFGLPDDDRGGMAELARRHALSVVALTRGGRGSLLLRDGDWSDHPGVSATVIDTVGAGDAFAAAMVLGLLAGRPLDAINAHANAVAAFVCSQPGATPDLPEALRRPS